MSEADDPPRFRWNLQQPLIIQLVPWFLFVILRKRKPKPQPVPMTALEFYRERYANGEISFLTFEAKVGQIINGEAEPVIAPPVEVPPLPPPRIDKNAALRARLRAEVEQYQRSNDK